jgi:diaminopimelate epimerase
MRFAKMHGLGNDFVMINGFAESLPVDIASMARQICHRRLGLGADGLIILAPSDHPQAIATFLIYNSDGSQAETCGNGLRCAALFAKKEGIATGNAFIFELMHGLAAPEIIDEPLGIVCVDMGEPRLLPEQIPADFPGERVVGSQVNFSGVNYQITLVSMGNPHCVIFVDDVSAFPVSDLGPKIETHPLFPAKTNVEFIQRIDASRLKMRVWERGCGETKACGSGACAAVVAAILNGYVEQSAVVELAYGELLIRWADNNHIYMTGPATLVAEGEYLL